MDQTYTVTVVSVSLYWIAVVSVGGGIVKVMGSVEACEVRTRTQIVNSGESVLQTR